MKTLVIIGILLTVTGMKSCTHDICTPAKYLNRIKNKKERYSGDSLIAVKQIKAYIEERKVYFYREKESFQQTQFIIDTILYSSSYSKMALIIIAKTPVSRLGNPNQKQICSFEGTYFLGRRNSKLIDLERAGPGFTNDNNQKDLSDLLRETYFCELSSLSNKNTTRYNINDVRFWQSSIWNEHAKDR